MPDYLSFTLKEEFIDQYRECDPDWGFPIGAGNSLGLQTWLSKYARRKADGTREHFWEGLRRVIEGVYSIQKDYAAHNGLPWNEDVAHASAQEAYIRAWDGKWSAPGRGLWCMGTEIVNGKHDGSALYNCSFLSSAHIGDMTDPSLPFHRLMEELMMGIGVGFDVLGAGKLCLHQPEGVFPYQVADSREGWAQSVGSLLRAFFLPRKKMPLFDYSRVRPAGSPIHGFGGVASGPGILKELHEQLVMQLSGREGQPLTSTDITDIMNKIGKAVIAGNVRRSAEIGLGLPDDEEFLDLKSWEKNPERTGFNGWAHLSNNCLGYETEIVTRSGIVPIGSIAGTTVQLRDGNGKWVYCSIKSYGESELLKVTWQNNGRSTYVTYATPNHRWLVKRVKNEAFHEVRTADLKPGLFALKSTRAGVKADLSPVGIQAGFIYGDGTSSAAGAKATFCGMKDKALLPFFEGHTIYTDHRGIAYTSFSFPRSWKQLPSLQEGSSYLYGWLAGYFAADGCVSSIGTVRLVSASEDSIRTAQAIATIIGIDTFPVRDTTSPNPFTGEPHTMYSVGFNLADIPDNFFIIPEHRERASRYRGQRQRNTQRWTVKSIETTGRTEEVFCAEVPTTHTFMLANGLLTGNSVIAQSGQNLDHLVPRIINNGEPGVYWLDIAQNYGRLIDPPEQKEYRTAGINPCGEIPLENFEKCNLVETFPTRADNLQDYLRTLKFAFLYSKSITLLPVKWSESNEVMIRNRRIGVSMSGVAQFAEDHGWNELQRWQNLGYQEIRKWDEIYSSWLGVRESIRVTTVKPSGTVSLLWGVTPGVHYPRERGYFVRTIREMKDSLLAKMMEEFGYPVEPSVSDPNSMVVISLPVEGPDLPSEREVSVWQKVCLAVQAQKYWSDNAVSVTISFSEDEAKEIPAILKVFDGQLKSVSFLPMQENVYQQAPYQRVTREVWDAMRSRIKPIDWDALYGSSALPEPEGELYCSNDTCEIR